MLIREDVDFPRSEFLSLLKTQSEHTVLVSRGDLVGVQVFVKLQFQFVASFFVGVDSSGIASFTGDGEELSLRVDAELVFGHSGKSDGEIDSRIGLAGFELRS